MRSNSIYSSIPLHFTLTFSPRISFFYVCSVVEIWRRVESKAISIYLIVHKLLNEHFLLVVISIVVLIVPLLLSKMNIFGHDRHLCPSG